MVHKRTRRRLRGGSKRRTVKRTSRRTRRRIRGGSKRRTVKRTKRRIKGGSKRRTVKRTKRRKLIKRGGYIGEDWKERRRLKNEYEQELAFFNRKSLVEKTTWMDGAEFPQIAPPPDAGGLLMPPPSAGIEARAEEFRKKMKKDYETKVTRERDARHQRKGKTSVDRLKYEGDARASKDVEVKKYRAWKKGKVTAQVKKLGLDGLGDKVNDIELRLAIVEGRLPPASDVESDAELMAQFEELEVDTAPMNPESTSDFGDISELEHHTDAGAYPRDRAQPFFEQRIGSSRAAGARPAWPGAAVSPDDISSREFLDKKIKEQAAARDAQKAKVDSLSDKRLEQFRREKAAEEAAAAARDAQEASVRSATKYDVLPV